MDPLAPLTPAARAPRSTRKFAAVLVARALALLLAATAFPSPSPAKQGSPPPSNSVASTVPNGTRFLVRLNDELSTRKSKVNKKFKAYTLEPLQTSNGSVLPPGAEIRGHVSRIEPAGVTGHARMWLTFDEIKTPAGKMPLVADVVSVPGDHAVKQGESKEGEIEARTSKGVRDLEAAAAGAAIGAVVGGAAKGGKAAGIGAAIGGATGFLISSGMGQELDLPKGTKLELELDRPLYIAKTW
jgi:hypothetical protein